MFHEYIINTLYIGPIKEEPVTNEPLIKVSAIPTMSMPCSQPRPGYPYPRNSRTGYVSSWDRAPVSPLFHICIYIYTRCCHTLDTSVRLTYAIHAFSDVFACMLASLFDTKLGRSLGERREKHEFRPGSKRDRGKRREEIRGGRRSSDADSSRFMGAVFERRSSDRVEIGAKLSSFWTRRMFLEAGKRNKKYLI